MLHALPSLFSPESDKLPRHDHARSDLAAHDNARLSMVTQTGPWPLMLLMLLTNMLTLRPFEYLRVKSFVYKGSVELTH